jgi:hypothetical protein
VTTISVEENQLVLVEMLMACENSGLATKVVGPNHDPGGAKLWEVTEFTRETMEHAGRGWLTTMESLPHPDFIRLMAHAAVMVGNSSAGIREACYFGTPVVDVGIRQQRRAASRNVLTVSFPDRDTIQTAIAFYDQALGHDPGFGRGLRNYTGVGGALEAPAPFGTLIAVEWGYGVRGVNTDGTLGTQVLRVSGYKMF